MVSENFKKHLLYWVIPSAVTLACILIYFLNPFNLSIVIAPKVNRELGLVENIQLLILLLIFLKSIKGAKFRTAKLERYGFRFIAVATAFIFFEEIDYGLHYYDYLSYGMHQEITRVTLLDKEVRNFHNSDGAVLSAMKMASYSIIALFFVILPLIPLRLQEKFPILLYFTPSRFIIGTAISLLILNQTAFFFYRYYEHSNPALNGNVSEFEEMLTYYIGFLYLSELLKKPQGLLTLKGSLLYRRH